MCSSDLTNALGYTPANKAGEQFTGAISSSGSITGSSLTSNTTVTSTGNLITTGILSVTYTGVSGDQNTGAILSSANTKGGTGYSDFLRATNNSGGATNINKWFRLDSGGQLQIINSAYTTNILNLTDAGLLTVPSISTPTISATTGVTVNTSAYITTTSYTTAAAVTQVTVDTFATSTYRSAKYLAQMATATAYHVIELRVLHDGTTVWLNQYGEIFTGSSLGTFDASITAGNLNLLFTPASATATTIKVVRTGIVV
mgnify:FL=1